MNTNEHRLALPAGCQLNDLQIKNVLGHGGFGITYRAWDRYLKKHVALKETAHPEAAAIIGCASLKVK